MKNLKRGHNAFTSKIQKTFSSGKEDRKGEEDCNDYPADFNEMQGCDCVFCESTPISALANSNRDSGLQRRTINSYTTTGHTLPQSHLPTKQDAYITTHQWCQRQKQEHSQPLQLVLSSTQSTPYILITSNRLLFSCSRPDGNKQWWTPNARLRNYCQPAQNEAASWSNSGPWPRSGREYLWDDTGGGGKAIYVHEQEVLGQPRHSSTASHLICVSGSSPIYV